MNTNLIIRIENLCSSKGVTIGNMLKSCGLPSSTFDNIKKGSKPAYDKIEKIADYFGVSVDYLLGREQTDDVTDEDLMYALFGGEGTDAQLEEVKKYAAFIKQRDKE